jgi:hypothetical protein
MEGPFGEFFDVVNNYKFNNMTLIEDENFFNIFDAKEFKPNKNPNNKELRLALDLIDDIYPLYKHIEIESKTDFLRDIFKMEVSKERLQRLNSHKDILFKYIITGAKPGSKTNKVIIRRVIK